MGWVKSQTWSPDEVAATEDFHTFTETDPSGVPHFQQESQPSEAKVDRFAEGDGTGTSGDPDEIFALAPGYWNALFEDRFFRARYDRLVSDEVKKRVEAELETARREKLPLELEAGRKEGFEKGYAEGKRQADEELRKSSELFEQQRTQARAEWEAQNRSDREQMEFLMTDFKSQWADLLKSHEAIWCETMIHLLKRFQVENGNRLGRTCEEWLEKTVPEIATKTPISVYVGPERAKQLQAILGASATDQWRIVEATDLTPEQTRFEAAGGGAFFDAEAGYQKLFEFLGKAAENK